MTNNNNEVQAAVKALRSAAQAIRADESRTHMDGGDCYIELMKQFPQDGSVIPDGFAIAFESFRDLLPIELQTGGRLLSATFETQSIALTMDDAADDMVD